MPRDSGWINSNHPTTANRYILYFRHLRKSFCSCHFPVRPKCFFFAFFFFFSFFFFFFFFFLGLRENLPYDSSPSGKIKFKVKFLFFFISLAFEFRSEILHFYNAFLWENILFHRLKLFHISFLFFIYLFLFLLPHDFFLRNIP